MVVQFNTSRCGFSDSELSNNIIKDHEKYLTHLPTTVDVACPFNLHLNQRFITFDFFSPHKTKKFANENFIDYKSGQQNIKSEW